MKVEIQKTIDGEYFIQLPQEALNALDAGPGDTLHWEDLGNGSFSLKKKMRYYKVVCLQSFRMEYVVEVPDSQVVSTSDLLEMVKNMDEVEQVDLGLDIVSVTKITDEDIRQRDVAAQQERW